MFYSFSLTVPAGKTEASPAKLDMKLSRGIITRVFIGFPVGCNRYVYCRVRDPGLHQVYPTNPDHVFRWSGSEIVWDEYHELGAPYTLVAEGWAPSAVYNHTIDFRFAVLPVEIAQPLLRLADIIDKLARLFVRR